MLVSLRIASTALIPDWPCPWVIASLQRARTQAQHCFTSILLTAGDWGVMGNQRERQRCKGSSTRGFCCIGTFLTLFFYSPPHTLSKHSVALERWNTAHMPKWLFSFAIICITQAFEVEHLVPILLPPLCQVKDFLSVSDLLLFQLYTASVLPLLKGTAWARLCAGVMPDCFCMRVWPCFYIFAGDQKIKVRFWCRHGSN